MAQKRCGVCNCFIGKVEDHCPRHHPNANDDEKNVYDDFPGSFDGEFFPSEYRIIKDKFGIEDR